MSAPPLFAIDWSLPLPRTLHASAVTLSGAGLLLVGPSGSGKSALALELMSRGAALVSDDLTHLRLNVGQLTLSPPPDVPPVPAIEARGLGLLHAPLAGPAPLTAIVDLSLPETARLPARRVVVIEGRNVPLIGRVDTPAFPAMLLQLLRGGLHSA